MRVVPKTPGSSRLCPADGCICENEPFSEDPFIIGQSVAMIVCRGRDYAQEALGVQRIWSAGVRGGSPY